MFNFFILLQTVPEVVLEKQFQRYMLIWNLIKDNLTEYLQKWNQILSSIKDEINLGTDKLRFIVDFKLSDSEWFDHNRGAVVEYLSCLRMMLLVARLISATICDCLCCSLDDTE